MTEKLPEHRCPLDSFKPSDLRSLLDLSAQHYLRITQQSGLCDEYYSCPDGEKAILAVYLNDKWWDVDDILQSCVPIQEGLKQVQTCGERLVLFVLNCLVCGFVEGSGSENGVCFLPHTAGELAKILWHHGEALAFYTYKKKGSLCDRSHRCYLLPVLDTIYVRKRWRRQGFGITMLQDFCQTFSQEVALGISSPISPKMYHVCGRFLADNPKERDRLWEVDPPGDWSQRTNIWLRIQLGETPTIKECSVEKAPECTEKEIATCQRQAKHLTDEGSSFTSINGFPACLCQPLGKKRRRDGKQMEKKQKKKGKKKMRKKTSGESI